MATSMDLNDLYLGVLMSPPRQSSIVMFKEYLLSREIKFREKVDGLVAFLLGGHSASTSDLLATLVGRVTQIEVDSSMDKEWIEDLTRSLVEAAEDEIKRQKFEEQYPGFYLPGNPEEFRKTGIELIQKLMANARVPSFGEFLMSGPKYLAHKIIAILDHRGNAGGNAPDKRALLRLQGPGERHN